MSDHPQSPPTVRGISLDDLPLVNRTLFDHAVRAATDLHDPATNFGDFVETLWAELANVFEWSEQHRPEEILPRFMRPP